MIRMPLVDGEISGACKTEGELAADIKRVIEVLSQSAGGRLYKGIPRARSRSDWSHQRAGTLSDATTPALLDLLIMRKVLQTKRETINIVRAPRSGLCNNARRS